MHHSDDGFQHTSAKYGAVRTARDATLSLIRSGQCLDNVIAKGLFPTMQPERIAGHTEAARTEAAGRFGSPTSEEVVPQEHLIPAQGCVLDHPAPGEF